MAHRQFTAVDRVPFVAGRLCLDFVNTIGDRAAERPRERLVSYADLLTWSRRAAIVDTDEERRLATHAQSVPKEAMRTLERARTLRETLYRLFRAGISGDDPAERDLAETNAWAAEIAAYRRLVATSRGLRWVWATTPTQLELVVWPIVHSAVELLTTSERERLRQCGECDWLFLDTSPNRTRRWCKKACGDRVKARRYYRRKTTAPEES